MGIPGTESTENPQGAMVETYWDQDESGALCSSGHSDGTTIPLNVEPMTSLAPAPRRAILGGAGVGRGFVLDPNHIIGSDSH